MKVVIDLLCVRQEYVPDSGRSVNKAVFNMGGFEFEVEAPPDAIEAIITEAELQKRGAGPLPETQQVEDYEEPEEQVWGGDFEPNPPAMFQEEGEVDLAALEPVVEEATPAKLPVPILMSNGRVLTDREIANLGAGEKARLIALAQQRFDRKDPTYMRMVRKHELRRRAEALPARRADVDESGNLRVPQRAEALQAVQTVDPGRRLDPDDDGVPQG